MTYAPVKPFFIYLAHQVPKAWANKHKGQFDQVWDVVRVGPLPDHPAGTYRYPKRVLITL